MGGRQEDEQQGRARPARTALPGIIGFCTVLDTTGGCNDIIFAESNFETVTFKSLNIALFYLLKFTIVQTACTET